MKFSVAGVCMSFMATLAMVPTNLIRRDSRGIRFEGKVEQFIHGLQIVPRIFRGNVELQMIHVDAGKRNIHPASGFGDSELSVANRLEILIERYLILAGQKFPQRPRSNLVELTKIWSQQ